MISFKDGLITFSLKFKENLQVQLSLRRFLYNNLIKLGIKKELSVYGMDIPSYIRIQLIIFFMCRK